MVSKYKTLTAEQRVKANESNRAWKSRNKEKVAEYKKKHYRENRDKYLTIERDRAYKKRYGISLADYDAMYVKQSGVCLICKSDKAGNKGQCFAVDHCHATGVVRGLLCIKCNARLGWFESHAFNVIKYLGLSVNKENS